MSFDACAALVQRADPDRFRTALLAPPETRPGLMALYAFNIEVSRAPWVTPEPMIALMRLQWWADTIAEIFDGKPPRAHEIAQPLAETISRHALPRAPFDTLIEARRADTEPAPFPSLTALETYVDATATNLMRLAAAITTPAPIPEAPIRDLARASGTAAFLTALPALIAAGRKPLPLGARPGPMIQSLAETALIRLARARAQRRAIPREAAPALLPSWKSAAILTRAASDPAAALSNRLAPSEFRARCSLLIRAPLGRW